MRDEVHHLALPWMRPRTAITLATITMRRDFVSLPALTGRSATVVR
jgi:hypothetical protein